MRDRVAPRSKSCRRPKKAGGRATIGIRELKARASAIIEEVKDCRTSYAVTKRGEVEALIVPVDAGERLLSPSPAGERMGGMANTGRSTGPKCPGAQDAVCR